MFTYIVAMVLIVAAFVAGMLFEKNNTKKANAALALLQGMYDTLKNKVGG